MKPIAYEGKEPYIFISYAHKDSEKVMQVLSELDERGYRIWYDDGIAPGSEWPEDIARHLDAAQMVIAFVTPNSMASQNCRREINFALSKEKHFLSVLLERTEMPLGMEMQLSAQQSILRYNYSTWEAFIGKILLCPDIVPCKKPVVVPEPPAMPSQPLSPTASVIPATVDPVSPAAANQVSQTPPIGQAVAPVSPPPQVLPAKKEKKAPKQKAPKPAKPRPNGTTSKSKMPLLFGAIGAVTVIVTILVIVLFTGKSYKASWGQSYERSMGYIDVYNQTVTQKDLVNIMKMKKMTSVSFTNCDFSGCDFSSLKVTDSLKNLNLSDSSGINDYSFLSSLHLQRLELKGQKGFTDLSSLDVSNLQTLDLTGTGVSNIALLKDAASLTTLSASDTKISDISVLSGLTKLTTLRIADTNVSSIDALTGMSTLTEINISNCSIEAFPSELTCIKLTSFVASGTGLKDLHVLNNCTLLKTLDISNNPELTDFDTVIEQNGETLTSLDISRCAFPLEEVNAIASCTKLTYLGISGLTLGNLDFCHGMADLKTINAENCALTDITGLQSCEALQMISLGYNQITELSGLKNITVQTNQTSIDLSFNRLADASALPEGTYHMLLFHGNDPSLPLSLDPSCKSLVLTLDYSDSVLESSLTTKGTYTSIYLTDCPVNEIVAIEEALGTYVHFVSADELMDMILNDQLYFQLRIDYSYIYSLYKNQ